MKCGVGEFGSEIWRVGAWTCDRGQRVGRQASEEKERKAKIKTGD